MADEKKILLIAGEASGDLHGAALIAELKKLDPSISFYGMGGDRMQKEGMYLVEHIKNMSFLGFFEILKHLPNIRLVKKKILETVEIENISTVVLIDYPGFNLNIAKKLKKMNAKIIYYITPQVWAWGKGRVKQIRKLIDKVLVILPFEKDFFKKYDIDAVYTGHPLIDRISNYQFVSKERFFQEHNLDKSKGIIALLPGSRTHEVETIFPEAIKAATRLSDEYNLQTVVACSENLDQSIFDRYAPHHTYTLIKGKSYELLKYADSGIIKSGTSTVEAALLGLPMVIVYRTNPITYFIGKTLVNLEHIGLVNIIADKTIIPELIQDKLTADNLYKELKKYFANASYKKEVIENLKNVSSLLGESGASKHAAQEIKGVMGNA